MTKLKTLKDIEIDLLQQYKEVGDEDNFTFPEEELKKEAIKWMKSYSGRSMGKTELQPQTFIIKFFNITSRELKDD